MLKNSKSEFPLVSVCIPTFNRAAKLQRAIQALSTCTYASLEIIISDNGSTDLTQEVCKEICNSNPKVRYFRHSINQGPTKNFEFARSKARGKYFLWHGDDDYLSSDFIRMCVNVLEKDPSLGVASGLAAYHSGDEKISGYGNLIQLKFSLPLTRVIYYIFMVEDNSIFCGLYRRDLVAKCRMPNCLAGDWVWISQVLLEGPAVVLPSVFVYREQGNSTSSSMLRIVSTLNLPVWHAKFPWLIRPFNLSYHVAFDSNHFRHSNRVIKFSVFLYIFFGSLLKQFIHMVLPKVPFGKRIYERVFLRNFEN